MAGKIKDFVEDVILYSIPVSLVTIIISLAVWAMTSASYSVMRLFGSC